MSGTRPRSTRLPLFAFLAALAVCSMTVFVASRRTAQPASAPASASSSPANTPVELQELDVSGCASVRTDGACALREETTLRAWVAGDATRVTFDVDGARVTPERTTALAQGTRVELRVRAGAALVRASRDGAPFATRPIVGAAPIHPAVAQARALRAGGKLDEAKALLEAERSRDANAARDPLVLGTLARIALALDDVAHVDELFTASIDAHERDGSASGAVDDAGALVFSLLERARLAEASQLIERAMRLSKHYPDGRAELTRYRAGVAADTGDHRAAILGFRDAAAQAERLGLDRFRRMSLQEEAMQLDAIGRVDDALDALTALHAADGVAMQACDRADLEGNVGWIALHQRKGERVDARMWLRRALASMRSECPASYDASRVATFLGYAARAEIDHGAIDEALARMREAAAAAPHPPAAIDLEWRATRADIALAKNDVAGALREIDGWIAAAEAIGARDSARDALERRSDALLRRGDRAGALDALARAGKIVDLAAIDVPLGEGRESYVRARESADVRRIELLVALDRPDDALRELRRARSRVLDALVGSDRIAALAPASRARWEDAVGAYRRERDAIEHDVAEDWRYSAETLAERKRKRATRVATAQADLDRELALVAPARGEPPPLDTPGELALALFVGARGWHAFASEGGRVRSVALGAVDPRASRDVLATRLVAPFDAELGRAKRVAVLAFGSARGVDLHALPFRGAPLGTVVPVVYPLDRARNAGPAPALRHVLVVADPTSDLRGARAELEAIEQTLAGASLTLTVLRDKRASGDEVRAALGDADVFHYAGHGRFAGRDGWSSALRLAGHSELSVADVLALARAPRVVLLLGCETARESGEAEAPGLGLAQAFLIAGAQAVAAASREVGDDATAAIARDAYARLAAGADLPDAMRAAFAAAAARGDVEWEAFRVLLP